MCPRCVCGCEARLCPRDVGRTVASVGRAVSQAFGAAWRWIKEQLHSIKMYVERAWNRLKEAAARFVGHCIAFIQRHIPKWLQQAVVDFVSSACARVMAHLSAVATRVAHAWSRFKAFIAEHSPQWMKEIFDFAKFAVSLFTHTLYVVWTNTIGWMLDCIFVRSRALADIARFAKWGNSEVVSTRNQMLLFDAELNAQGISDQRMRRRSALQAVWQAGWMAWHFGWDPSLELNLNTGLSEVAQYRQERANQDFLQDHQRSVKKWSRGLAVLGLTLGIVGLLVTMMTAGMGTFIFVAQAINVITAAGSLAIMHLQELAQEDSTLTEEARQETQDRLSLWQGILGVVGLATLAFDFFNGAASQVAGGLGAGAAQAVGMLRTRTAGLVRAVSGPPAYCRPGSCSFWPQRCTSGTIGHDIADSNVDCHSGTGQRCCHDVEILPQHHATAGAIDGATTK